MHEAICKHIKLFDMMIAKPQSSQCRTVRTQTHTRRTHKPHRTAQQTSGIRRGKQEQREDESDKKNCTHYALAAMHTIINTMLAALDDEIL